MYKIWKDTYDLNKYIQEKDDYIHAVGGDGTLLRAIQMHKNKNKPFFGVAAGSVNFLMNGSPFLEKTYKVKSFNLIKVKVKYRHLGLNNKKTIKHKTFQGFNDAVIGGNMNSWISFNVHDKDKIVRQFNGGGLIISTAQGSTGINKNNGGVVLPLSSHNWSITGDKTDRKISYVLEPHRTSIKVESRTPVTVWVDGANNVVSDVISIEITKGDSVKVIFNEYDSFKKKRM